MNAYSPPAGTQIATVKFVGSAGASLSFNLVAGQNIRDYYQGAWANTLSNGITGVEAVNAFTCVDPTNCLGSGATGDVKTGRAGTYNIDEQHFSLGSTFAGQTLTQIIITDTNGSSTPAILAATVGASGAAVPTIKSGGVVSASAFGDFSSISPGTWIEIYGSNLATDSRSWAQADFNGINAPTSLDGTTVTIGGQPAFIDYISPAQVNALVASGTPAGAQQLTVTVSSATGAARSATYSVTVNATEPGLLAPPTFNIGGVQYAVGIFSDGAYALPAGAISGVNSRPAKPGDVLTFYGVGFGSVTPNSPAGQLVQQLNTLSLPFQISIGGVPASVEYNGLAPGYTGLYQFNVTVPNAASGNAAVAFTLNGTNGTQTLSIAVQD
jgi:uncharacterized protein (TIGR03437 family)